MMTLTRALMCSALACGVTGCANVKLYSEARDKQGEAALAARKKVDVQSLIATERTNLDKLLQAELATQDKLVASIRDQNLRGLVLGSESFADAIQARLSNVLKAVTGSAKPTFIRAAATNQRLDEQVQRIRDSRRHVFERNGLQVPSCADFTAGGVPWITAWTSQQPAPPEAKTVVASATLIKTLCTRTAITVPDGSKLQIAMEERDTAVSELKQYRQDAAAPQLAYATALAEYTRAVKETEVGEPGYSQRVQEKAKKLGDAVKALDKAGNALSKEFLSKERIDKIQSFAKAVTETPVGTEPPEDASEAAVAFIVIPALFDDARKAMRESRKPLAIPLLIRMNYERLNLEAAKRDIASREAIVKLSEDLVRALMEQATELELARSELESAQVKPGTSFATAFIQTDASTPPDALWRGATRYLDATNRLEAGIRKIEYRRIAAYQDQALAYAEVNARQWDSLIGTSVEQLAAYSKSGIKAENVTAIINSLGLLWIGAGVNR